MVVDMTGFNSKRDAAAKKLQDSKCKCVCHDGCAACDALAQPVQKPVDIAKFVEGMEVSIDVSTGDHDSTNRLFGTVTLVQQNQGSKHGLILLVQDPAPNFKPAAQPAQEPVARVIFSGEEIVWLTDEPLESNTLLYTAPPQRPWVGLTPEETSGFTQHEMTVVKYVNKVLREKNA